MADHHRRADKELVQQILLDDPQFLRRIVERTLQQLLEAEITEHIGAAPYERTPKKPQRAPQRLQTEEAQNQGRHPRASCTPGPGGNLLNPPLLPLPTRNEKALVLALMQMYVEGVSTRGRSGR
jgi:putative transposase